MKLNKNNLWNILNIGLYMIIFYMTISTNFISELYNPDLIYVLKTNLYVKHIIGYITLFTFIIVAHSSGNFKYDIKLSLITYAIFFMSTKIDPYYFLFSIVCIYIAYLLDKFNELYITDIKTKKKLETIYIYMGILGKCLIIYGFIEEYLKLKKKYNNNFSLHKFLFRKIN